MKKRQSVATLKQKILLSDQYVNDGCMIIVRNDTERRIFNSIQFFDILLEGEALYLNLSTKKDDTHYNKSIDLSAVHNINGIMISPEL